MSLNEILEGNKTFFYELYMIDTWIWWVKLNLING
jgi:hypothetical protein